MQRVVRLGCEFCVTVRQVCKTDDEIRWSAKRYILTSTGSTWLRILRASKSCLIMPEIRLPLLYQTWKCIHLSIATESQVVITGGHGGISQRHRSPTQKCISSMRFG